MSKSQTQSLAQGSAHAFAGILELDGLAVVDQCKLLESVVRFPFCVDLEGVHLSIRICNADVLSISI